MRNMWTKVNFLVFMTVCVILMYKCLCLNDCVCLFSRLYGSRPGPWHRPCKRSCCWSWVELPWCLLCCWFHPGNVPVCRSLRLRPSVETCRPSSSPYLWGSCPPRSPQQPLSFCRHGSAWTCTCRKGGAGQRSRPESHKRGNSREWPELPIPTTHTSIQQTQSKQISALKRKDHSKPKKKKKKKRKNNNNPHLLH